MKKKSLLLLLFSLCAAFSWALSEEERLFEEAERRYRKGDYQFAFSRYEKLISEYPNSDYSADAHFRKGVILFRMGRVESAAASLERVSSRYAYTRFAPLIPFWRGAAAYALEEIESALGFFDGYMEANDQSYREETLLYIALCRRRLGEEEKALNRLREISEDAGDLFDRPEAFRLYAVLLLETGRSEELLEVLQTVPTAEADEELKNRLTLYKAEALSATGRAEEAEELYLALLEAPAEISLPAYRHLFKVYLEEGREQESREILDAAQSALSGRPKLLNEFFLRVAIAAHRQQEYELAESYLRRIWRSLPMEEVDPLVPLYLSSAVERNAGPAAAFELLEDYIETDADSLERESRELLLLSALRLASEAERWKDAELYGNRFLQDYADSAFAGKASYLYAAALQRLGRPREALAVLSEVSRKREEGSFYDDITRLLSRVRMDLGNWEEAKMVLREYLPLHRKDPGVYVDLMRAAFSLKDWEDVVAWSDVMRKELPDLEKDEPKAYVQISYIEGLSRLAGGEYLRGTEILDGLLGKDERSGAGQALLGMEEIVPQVLFFAGWGFYRQAEYVAAVDRFSRLTEDYPSHPRADEGRYLIGWSAFADERYDRAEAAFAEYAKHAERESGRMKGLYMHGKSLSLDGRVEEALSVYRQVFEEGERSEVADDALFEYAALLSGAGTIEESAATYLRLFREYPRSTLAEEALYRRGELFLREGEYAAAREAYYEHRSRFSKGELTDVSLYWGAYAARKSGEPYGAILLLERLVEQFADSSVHADGLRELAELYEEQGEYEKAVRYYTRLRSLYPSEAKKSAVERRIDTIRGILDGKGPREAELSAIVEQKGFDTRDGRQAAVDLASLYLNTYTEKRSELRRRAIELLEEVMERKAADPRTAARAQYVLGEHYRRDGAPAEAAGAYAQAAVLARGDDDFTAMSMYMAAKSALKAGSQSDARRMVRTLEAEFPDSQWADEGRSLLK
jgi:TolA-binding protein